MTHHTEYLEIVAKVLQVDKELKADVLTKDIEWDNDKKEILVKVPQSIFSFGVGNSN